MNSDTKYYIRQRTEMARFLPRHYSRVLEVGCAEGKFAANLNQEREYWGVEPVEHVAERASEKLSKVLLGSYDEVCEQLPDNYFDLVICNDVMEHMIDPDLFLESIKSKMSDEAYLIGSIPNVRFILNLKELLVDKDWRYKDAGILDRTHFRFFTERSLRRMILDNGFEIEELKGINKIAVGWNSRSMIARTAVIGLLEMFSLGSYSDVKYRQFGFRIKHIGTNEVG